MKRKHIFLVLFSIAGLAAKAQECKPILKISYKDDYFGSLTLNKTDTIDVAIKCLDGCEIIAEAEGISIRSLGKGKFTFKPLSAGKKKLNIYSFCPAGTSATVNGKKMDMSGKHLYASEEIKVVNK